MGARVLIVGATGMIGRHALEACLEAPDVESVLAVSRRDLDVQHEKLRLVLHDNHLNYEAVQDCFSGVDLALYCIGVYTGAVRDDEFKKVTVDFTTSFAQMLSTKSPQATLCFLSGQGADQTEKSRVAFARYKGMAENALLSGGLGAVHIFRPGYIYPVRPREEPNLGYRIFRAVYPVVRLLYPNIGVKSDGLANAMVRVGLGKVEASNILENKDIRRVAATL